MLEKSETLFFAKKQTVFVWGSYQHLCDVWHVYIFILSTAYYFLHKLLLIPVTLKMF